MLDFHDYINPALGGVNTAQARRRGMDLILTGLDY